MLTIINEFENKKVLIWGMGREGKSTYELIRKYLPNQKIDICDAKQIDIDDKLVTFINQDDCDFNSYDLIMKAPGIVADQKIDASKIQSQSQLFLKHYGAQTIGVTGTKGKSTTSSLIYHVLHTYSDNVFLVGNIGVACFDIIEKMNDESVVVFEISCHQLEYSKYAPHIAVLLNLFEEHLDHYGTFDKYCQAKENILKYQSDKDYAIVNEQCLPLLKIKPNADLIGKDIKALGNVIAYKDQMLEIKDCQLLGEHNYVNLAVAYAVSKRFDISDEQFKQAVKTFKPLAHRLQLIGKYDGLTCIDDSISTIGQATIKAIEALKQVDVVLIGGLDRGIEYHELEDYLVDANVSHIVFMYASGKRIYEEMHDRKAKAMMHLVADLQSAVALAYGLDIKDGYLLLSPAAASYDHFKNFEERGEAFKQMVEKL